MDTAQWPQEMVVKPMEEILIPVNNNNNTTCLNPKGNNGNDNSSMERKMRPQRAQAVNCPRCNSTNTKFCYYNNYSLSQPRYFCKTCRRYWTEGGSLRNIPVGGGSRKNKKTPSNSSNNSSNSSKKPPHLGPSTNTLGTNHDLNHNPKLLDQGQDLNLGYDFKTISQLIQVPNFEDNDNKSHLSALELMNGNSNNSYMTAPGMPIHNDHMYSSGFSSLPTLGFSLDGIGNNGYGSIHGVEESDNIGRVLFPFEDLKQGSNTNDLNLEITRDQQGDSTGYWNGVLGGGSW